MLRRVFFSLALGLAASCAYAQAPSPADVGISKGTPDVFKLKGHDNVWTPFGLVDPSTHIFIPGTNGAIAPDDCIKWGPGLTSAGAACNSVTGGAHPANQLTIYTSHSGLVANVTTPTEAWTVIQQGFYAPGDGGDAIYNWNAASYCSSGTSGAPVAADGIMCVLPVGQAASAAGRYLLSLKNGILNAKAVGFRDDGGDNAPMVVKLNTILNLYTNLPINFPGGPLGSQSNYWFSQPLELTSSTSVSCGDGSRAALIPGVNLVFGPDVSGIRSEDWPLVGFDGGGAWGVDISGCGIFSAGFASRVGPSVAGNPTIPNSPINAPSQIAGGASNPDLVPAIGDGVALFNIPGYWFFSGSVTGNVLTVTSWGNGWSTTDPGIAVGQMLQGSYGSFPFGTYIKSTHAENPTYTGTGQLGTYEVYPPINTPIFPAQAITGTITDSWQTEVQSGPPLVATGTTITGCSTLSGSNCPSTAGSTLTLSNAPRLGLGYIEYVLPGPNTSSPYGSQMYNATTSLAGNTYGPFLGSWDDGSGLGTAGSVLTITSGPGGLNLGQTLAWGPSAAAPLTTTTTAPLTIGEGTLVGIPVASCAGITSGMTVVGTVSGNAVFLPGTTVTGCSGTTLTVDPINYPYPAGISTLSGSSLITIYSHYYSPYQMYVGIPVVGTGIAPNTLVTGPTAPVLYSAGLFNIPMSNPATASAGGPFYFGGATYAAPSGTTLTFLDSFNGYGTIIGLGTGTGGNGTYVMSNTPATGLAAGSTIYAIDTPSTIYVTGGPRMIRPQELIWSDAFPFGTVAAKIYGSSPSKQTVITAVTNSYGVVNARAAHAGGSGKMWVLSDGIGVSTASNVDNNLVWGFGVGLNMACAANNNFPTTGCGRSSAADNTYYFNLVGRLNVGNNSGGFTSRENEYDHNYVADIAQLSTVGGTYTSEMLQGEDESSNTHDMVGGCGTDVSTFTGIYASGGEWEGSCYVDKDGMISDQPSFAQQYMWPGPIFGGPADALFPAGTSFLTNPTCTGAPTSSFSVKNGVVTHC